MADKTISMTPAINTSVIAAQTKVISEVLKGFEPLPVNITDKCAEGVIGKPVFELRPIRFSYLVTAYLADGSNKTIRVLRYCECIKDFATAFWTREINSIH